MELEGRSAIVTGGAGGLPPVWWQPPDLFRRGRHDRDDPVYWV